MVIVGTHLLEVKFGSHLYGTDTSDSDLDLKVIFMPTAREILLGTHRHGVNHSGRQKAPGERNVPGDVDVERFSLDRFLRDLMEGQTWALDVLFAYGNAAVRDLVKVSELGAHVMNVVLDNRPRLLTRNVLAFVGYARKQAARYGIKGSRMDTVRRVVEFLAPLPDGDALREHEPAILALVAECVGMVSLEKTPLVSIVMEDRGLLGTHEHLQVCGRKVPMPASVKRAKECFGRILAEYEDRSRKASVAGGVDWKALSHAVRVNGEAVELLRTGWVTFPRPEREMLVMIKSGLLAADYVYALIEDGLAMLHVAHGESSLRDEPDRAFADDLVCRIYGDEVVRGTR